MHSFHMLRCLNAEQSAEFLFKCFLTPSLVQSLTSFYALEKELPKSSKALVVRQHFMDAIEIWLRTEPKTDDWFEIYLSRLRLMKEYLEELRFINGGKVNELTDKEAFFSVVTGESTEWIDIFSEDKNVGFLIMGTKPNSHPETDFYIMEAFVQPMYRRQGLMKKTLESFVETHKGSYCYFVLRKNVYAEKYWSNLFTKTGFKPLKIANMATDGLKQYAWGVDDGKY